MFICIWSVYRVCRDKIMFATLHKTLSWFRHNHSVKFYITLTCKTWAVSDSVTCDTHKDVTRLIHGHLNLIKILRKFSKWKKKFWTLISIRVPRTIRFDLKPILSRKCILIFDSMELMLKLLSFSPNFREKVVVLMAYF